jgi:predicted PurR-regulated permease PerM
MGRRLRTPDRPSLADTSGRHSDELRLFGIKLLMVVGLLLGLAFLSYIASLLVTIAVSLFLTLVFSPFLDSMNRYRIPDGVGIAIIFLVIFSFFAFAGAMIVPLVAGQLLPLVDTVSSNLSTALSGDATLPAFLSAFASQTDYDAIYSFLRDNAQGIFSAVKSSLSALSQGGINLVWGVGSTIVNTALIVVFTFFAALDRKRIARALLAFLPADWGDYARRKRPDVYAIIRAWVGGQSKLAFLLFLLTFAGLHSLAFFGIDMPNKFALAVIAGCMEFIPYLGTVLAFLPALLIALGISAEAVVAVCVLYVAIQQIEGNVLAPFVVGSALDISAFFFLVAVSIGGSLGGVFGVLIALPIAAIAQSLARDLRRVRAARTS